MLKSTLRAYIWGVICTLATAQAALGATLVHLAGAGIEMAWEVALLSFVICTVSGVAALLQRVNYELKENPYHVLPRPVLFCSMHMIGSWAAGLLAFVIAQQMQFDTWASLAAMMTASYKGAQWLEAYAETKVTKLPVPAPEDPSKEAL